MVRTRRRYRVALALVAVAAVLAPLSRAPRVAEAAVGGSCVIEGTMSIVPGLGATPGSTQYSLGGTASPCVNAVAGSFGATITCGSDTTAGCLSIVGGLINVSSSPFGSCPVGVVQHLGTLYTFACTSAVSNIGDPTGWFMLVATGSVAVPITSAAFVGSLSGL